MKRPNMSIMPVSPQRRPNMNIMPVSPQGRPDMSIMPVTPPSQQVPVAPMQGGINAGEVGQPWGKMFR